MIWDLPTFVEVGDKRYHITNKCDYRVVLDAFQALNDESLSIQEKVICAMLIFYKDLNLENIYSCKDLVSLQKEMFDIMNYGNIGETANGGARLMDWEKDFSLIAPAVSQNIGYDIRDSEQFTHWYSFLGGYMEMGECLFANIISIRKKRNEGKKLEKWEREFYQKHKKMIDLPLRITSEEQDFLDSDW